MDTGVTQQELSKQIHLRLDNLGFSRWRVWEKIHTVNKWSKAKDISTKRILNNENVEKIFVGSLRDGTGYHYFNDTDILQINHDILCCTHPTAEEDDSKVTFQLEQKNAPAGYFFLKLRGKPQQQKAYDNIQHALVDSHQGTFLSSKLFMENNDDVLLLGDGFLSANTHYKPPQGPSIPKYVNSGFEFVKKYLSMLNLKESEMDYVRAFPCQAEQPLQTWSCRNRIYKWPSPKTIQHVITLPAHMVPVGLPGSPQEDLQWRLSFTLAEIHLVQSFNNTQTKVFVLLKLIAKYYLKPVCSCMTSYTMKNVVLWLSETMPQKKFRQKHLLARLLDALKYLHGCIRNGSLPSYMIPERNLFAGKLKLHEQEIALEKLDFLIQNGKHLTTDFFHKPSEECGLADSIEQGLYFASLFDKMLSFRHAQFTCEQLAEYNTMMFLEKSYYAMIAFTNLFYTIPAIYTFGLCAIFPNEQTFETKTYGNPDTKKTITESRSVPSRRESNHTPDLDKLVEEKDTPSGTPLRGVWDSVTNLIMLLLFTTEYPLFWFNLCVEFYLGVTICMEFFFYCKRNYSRQTYIENLSGKNPVIRTFIPRDLHTMERMWFWINLFFMAIFFLVRMTCTTAPLNYHFYKSTGFQFKAYSEIVCDAISFKVKQKPPKSNTDNQQHSQTVMKRVPYLPS